MNPQVWWYLTRASGIVAWLMLTASVIWGVVLSTKAFPEHRRPAWLLDLHRWLGGLAVSFTAIHLGALVADSYVHFGLADLLVPYASSWQPGAVALGVVALWLLLAVEVTSLAMKRLPRRSLAVDPSVELCRLPARQPARRVRRFRHHPLAVPGHRRRVDRRGCLGHRVPAHPPPTTSNRLHR